MNEDVAVEDMGEMASRSGAPAGHLTLQERCDVVLSYAQTLYVNGQATEETVTAAERLGRALGLQPKLLPRWGELRLQAEDAEGGRVREIAANPTGVNMARVASTMRAVDELASGHAAAGRAAEKIDEVLRTPAVPAWLFALGAGAGAVALSVIFGISHTIPGVIIFVSAAAGALLRRQLASYSSNILLQPFCAALLAGVIGGLAVQHHLSSSLRLAVVCPCMVLVPGPHILNGALDLINGRIHLGAARLIFAGLVVAAISAGLLLGLSMLGASLPIEPAGKAVPLWLDVIAAGVAVAAYSIFFSTPWSMLPWPLAVGMLAHALRWVALTTFNADPATGAFLACLLVGLVLAPVARRRHMPFAAIGFASVVSMVPGVYLFRMASGLLQIAATRATPDIIAGTLADGVTALLITAAICFGLVVPKLLVDHMTDRFAATR